MKSVVVLSGGLDSTYNLLRAQEVGEVILALTFDYGQRAANKEITTAKKLCSMLDVPYKLVDLKWFADFTHTALVQKKCALPVGGSVDITSLAASEKTAKSVWVPNRNGIFLNIAAGFAEGLGATHVVVGFNLEEASTFPDNSEAFLNSVDQSFSFSTANKLKTACFSIAMNKTEIVKDLAARQFDLSLVWPCYQDGNHPCGECESCQRFARAVKANHREWPWTTP